MVPGPIGGKLRGIISSMARFARRHSLVVLASLLILSPSVLDWNGVSAATRNVSHSRDAVLGLIGIFVTARIIDILGKRRAEKHDKERFQGIATIAFRGLSQSVNDIGRILLAPVVGANLYAAGIPGFTEEDHVANIAQLNRLNVEPQSPATSGFWNQIDVEKLAVDLTTLSTSEEFVKQMVRTTSLARRLLQKSLAEWAPVMITVPAANDELHPGWILADQLVLLMESWRSVAFQMSTGSDIRLEGVRARTHYLETVRQYRSWLEQLQGHAKLPSRGFVTSLPAEISMAA